MDKEKVIEILKQFGFKKYNSGDSEYFLQSKVKVKPMKKYSMEYMLSLFGAEDEKPTIVEKVVKKVKKGVKKSNE